MKITYLLILFFTLFAYSTFAQSDSDSTKNSDLIYKLINKQDTKELQKLIDAQGVKAFDLNQTSSYLEYAINNCKISAAEVLIKNKIPLGKDEDETEGVLEGYIGEISCYLKQDAKKCLIPAFVLLVEHDYVQFKPTSLGKLNCYEDVLPEWYVVIQPVVKALMKKGLKVEESIINITGEKDNYLLEICKWENQYTTEENKYHQKAIRKYILFLKEQGVDFNTKIDGKKPIDLLSSAFQKKVR